MQLKCHPQKSLQTTCLQKFLTERSTKCDIYKQIDISDLVDLP